MPAALSALASLSWLNPPPTIFLCRTSCVSTPLPYCCPQADLNPLKNPCQSVARIQMAAPLYWESASSPGLLAKCSETVFDPSAPAWWRRLRFRLLAIRANVLPREFDAGRFCSFAYRQGVQQDTDLKAERAQEISCAVHWISRVWSKVHVADLDG